MSSDYTVNGRKTERRFFFYVVVSSIHTATAASSGCYYFYFIFLITYKSHPCQNNAKSRAFFPTPQIVLEPILTLSDFIYVFQMSVVHKFNSVSTFHTPMKLKLVPVKSILKTESLTEGELLLKLPQRCRLHSSHSPNVYSQDTVLRGAACESTSDTTNHNFRVSVYPSFLNTLENLQHKIVLTTKQLCNIKFY